MNKLKLLLLAALFFPLSASANCMWSRHYSCFDIGTSNIWSLATDESFCNGMTKPEGNTTQCCCAADVKGCCEKKDASGKITTIDLTGQECKKITYASTTFYQDKESSNNSCKVKNSCNWETVVSTTQQNGSVYTSGGCATDKKQSDDSMCPGTKPTGIGDEICCCPGAVASTPATPPSFLMPELQIPIPGLHLTPSSSISYVTYADGSYSAKIPWLSEYLVSIYNYGLSVAGILAAIVLMAGGVLWLISGGDASKISQAKELIAGSIAGLIILSCSYLILYVINPKLVGLKSLEIGGVKKLEFDIAKTKNNSTATEYKNKTCASDDELKGGVDFYATGYYKPAWEDSDNFRCIVAMQCKCPNGDDKTKNCDRLYGNTYPDYHPCKPFDATTAYCDHTKSGAAPKDGDIAGPDCSNLALGDQVCFKGKTYNITDAGGGIKGRRIDIWSGSSKEKALSETGVGTLTKGPCK